MQVENMNILSCDPGGTTGIAMQIVSPDRQQRLVQTMTTSTPEELYDLVARYTWDTVLCERFSTAGRMSAIGIYTIQLVGGVHALCHQFKVQFIYRSPQNRKAFQDDAAKYLLPTKHVIHEVDALAHLLAWKYFQSHSNE